MGFEGAVPNVFVERVVPRKRLQGGVPFRVVILIDRYGPSEADSRRECDARPGEHLFGVRFSDDDAPGSVGET
ncbi:hypothetical protein SDC9_184334 [bioreactor metagenome]|uniref:Uncharacterized protein n=1 Tax=bioreactor metagenome TaxID=1076179 RepID=A0A645HEM2_9ZZZZ